MSERVELDQKADTALLTGDVLVVQGLNQLKGRRLFVNRTSGRTELTSPDGPNAGRISARMMQKPAKPGETSEPAAEPAGFAAQGFKSKPGAPLDVEAGRLDVNDTQKVAVFTGKVVAKQDTFTLNSDVLEAYYTGSAALADPAGPQTASGDAPPTELSRVKATTNVVMISTDGRKVTGDWAEFDAKTNKAIVGGEVVLTQGKSRVLGSRLIIDMTTGQSTIDTAPANTVAAPAGGGWVTESGEGLPAQTGSGRPSATFFPNEFKKKGQKPAATSQPAGTANQWNSGPDQPTGGN
jgi:lipopolysaccharide export system protein LptA